ncbi:hypothetical protein BJY04DRAFT_222185 [Aspergillus karnatakaensis]|uniref:uncharacterized protein n=1 Tax=Aspergillus karnatakaensis TaxID=1810916 RepID=UPI003CCD1C98
MQLLLASLLYLAWLCSADEPKECPTGRTNACINRINNGNNPPRESRLADCSSYQAVIVTPTPTTITNTVTETITVTGGGGDTVKRLLHRQVTISPTAVPTYLSPGPCTFAGIYGSACSCLGIPQTTSTAPPETSTVEVTVTETITSSPPGPTCAGTTCNNLVFNPCPDLSTFGCPCALGTDGESYCFAFSQCGDVCNTNADCPSGSACMVDTCCGEPTCEVLVDYSYCNPITT